MMKSGHILRSRPIQLVCLILCLAFPLAAIAEMADTKQHPECPLCGMNRAKFAHSRVLVTYEDGSETGTCSIHCAAMDLALKIDKMPESIQVGEYDTGNLIDAEKAFWVIGGDQMGVMTTRAKWAFKDKSKADAFIRDHGGKLATFDDAMKAAFEDMYEDTMMIRKKRRMMQSQKAHEHQ